MSQIERTRLARLLLPHCLSKSGESIYREEKVGFRSMAGCSGREKRTSDVVKQDEHPGWKLWNSKPLYEPVNAKS